MKDETSIGIWEYPRSISFDTDVITLKWNELMSNPGSNKVIIWIFTIIMCWVVKESKIIATTKLKRV